MSKDKYPAGTVADATVRGTPNVRVMRTHGPLSCTEWVSANGTPHRMHQGADVTEVHPLVVLDLSPHEVMRALEALRGSRGMVAMQVADKLEAASRPPKPVEPTGLGAVVEDTRGGLWVRWCHNAHTYAPWLLLHTDDTYSPWGEIDAVRVLSEGVTG